MLSKIKKAYLKNEREKLKKQIDNFTEKYIKENNLTNLIKSANESSDSRGPQVYDYVILHSLIRAKRPKYVLECGTGKSTWLIADALRLNYEQYGIEGKVVSMENIQLWYDKSVAAFPEHLQQFAEIKLSARATYMYSFVKGVIYSELPDYPYEVVFVDGPDFIINENGRDNSTANMDFIKVLASSTIPVTAVIDYRLNTVIAYGVLLGKNKVKFLKPWNIGLIENATAKDLLDNENAYNHQVEIIKNLTQFKFDTPGWIKL